MVQADHITVTHGSLTVDVPRSIFRGRECKVDPERAESFKKIMQDRYPWLTDNSVEVLIKKARMEMARVRDEETNGREHSRNLAASGKIDQAIEHMQLHLELEPDDGDSWYELGNLLCQAGRVEEGYKAFNKGRKVFKACQKAPRTRR